MKKKALIVVALLSVAFALGFLLRTTPLPPKSLDFTFKQVPSTNNSHRKYSVIVSNISDESVMYSGGFYKFWFEITYLTNGVWGHERVSTPGGGNGVMLPHTAERDSIQIPESATKWKIGLDITSLSWRGRLAWKIAHGSPFGGVLRPVAGFLITSDDKNRSKMEWSDEVK